jgi:hypothetical protein
LAVRVLHQVGDEFVAVANFFGSQHQFAKSTIGGTAIYDCVPHYYKEEPRYQKENAREWCI